MASLISTPKPAGRSRAMEGLDHLLQDLYVANDEENRLIEKEKQHIQALETAILERQKLIQNHQKITSQTDKDIKHAHQQFKNNRATCESLKSQYSVLQQHCNDLYKKQDDVNNKWRDKRANLSRRVDQYEGTWQTYQAKYEESELAMQLLDVESHVTLVKDRLVKAQKTVEQLRQSITKLQQVDTDENQTFKSLNAYIIRIAEVKQATNKFIRETGDKQLNFVKLQESGLNLQQQEKHLRQQLEEAQIAQQEQETLRKERERQEVEKQRKEAEKQRKEEQARQREIQCSQGKPPYRSINGGNPIQHNSPVTNIASTASWTNNNHVVRSNAAISQLTPPPPAPQQVRKPPPFIQMPVLSSSSSSMAKQAKLTTSLGVEKGVKPSTAPRFTLQIPVLPQQQQQQQKQNLTSQSVTVPASPAMAPSPGSAATMTTQQLMRPQSASTQDHVTSNKQPETGETIRSPPSQPQVANFATPAPYTGGSAINENQSCASGNNVGSPAIDTYQQQQEEAAGAQPHSYALLPAADNDDMHHTPSRSHGIYSYREEVEAIKTKSPGFVLPSRPMFAHGDQVNTTESEAMESTTSSGNFQDFSSIFSGNSFSQKNQANSPNMTPMFASPQVSSVNDKRKSDNSKQSFGGFMMPSSDNARMNFNNPSDMFGNPGSPVPSSNTSGGGGVLSMFGGGGDADSRQGATNSPAGFSFSFGGGSDSPRVGGSSSQPFSLF